MDAHHANCKKIICSNKTCKVSESVRVLIVVVAIWGGYCFPSLLQDDEFGVWDLEFEVERSRVLRCRVLVCGLATAI